MPNRPGTQDIAILSDAAERARALGFVQESNQLSLFFTEASSEGIAAPDKARWLAFVLTVLGFGQSALPWFALAVGDGQDARRKAAEMQAQAGIAACQWHVDRLQAVRGDSCLHQLNTAVGPMLADLIENPVPEQTLQLLGPLRKLAALALGVSWRQSHLIAQVMQPLLRHASRTGILTFPQARDDFNTAWHLIWGSAWGLEPLMKLDPFVDMLADQARQFLGATWKRKTGLSRDRPGVAYLTPFLETDRGIGSATHSLAKFHGQTHPEHRVFLYVIKSPDRKVKAFHAGGNVTLRFVENISESFVAEMDKDGIDVVLTDNYFWVTLCLLAVRIAPVQIMLDMTHIYDNLKEIDWWFIGSGDYRALRGKACKTVSALPFDRFDGTVRAPKDSKVAKIRSSLGGGPVVGFIGRLIKFSDDMISIAREILLRSPQTTLLICGPGDATLMNGLRQDEHVGARVKFVNEYVDVDLYGPAIDVFLDSHPFTGGETCREVMSYGVPVVTFENPDFAPLIAVGRDPDLVVKGRDEYIQTVLGLLENPGLRSERSTAAKEIAGRRGDMGPNVRQIAAKIQELFDACRSREPER